MASFLVVASLLLAIALGVVPEPDEYILNFPTGDNPLDIKVQSPASSNYFLLLGDWGAEALENRDVQQAVGDKMNAYYQAQSRLGMSLLGVLALGDNFYYTGQTEGCGEFVDHWSAVYGANLTDPSVQWLATMGNVCQIYCFHCQDILCFACLIA